jgi:hypothetical protein
LISGIRGGTQTERVFENTVLRRIFRPKTDEIIYIRLEKTHNEELRNLYSSSDIITIIKSRRVKWAWHAACTGKKTNAYRVLMGRPERKSPLGRPRRSWEDNIVT